MKRKGAKKHLMALGLLCCLFLMMPTVAFSWNQATHAYIVDQLGSHAGHDDLKEMWGSVAPDMYNFVFDPDLCPGWIGDQTQGTYADTFLKVWDAAETNTEEALAFGFVSHNQQWGGDHVAHTSCQTCGENDGYIIVKARLLLNAPVNPADPEQTFGEAFAGLGMDPDMALLTAHVIVEEAIDIRIEKEMAPLLGRRLAAAARSDTKGFQPLFVKAFVADYAAYCFGGDSLAAAAALTAAEKGHRKDMIFLGQAISQPEPVAVQLLAVQLTGVLSELGFSAPVDILKAAMFSAMGICDDYKAEIEAAVLYVGKSLKDHGITLSLPQGGRQKK
ncbi:hypothetical protein [Geomonas ferrireducens]|uniref:hypothetical protein n=1 Tax=Geomonas ferrireducens TaxID=2570227 RepID=UPI0010A79D30|nr:hypothetical protein [Geomonas ferrireducens]